MDEQEAEPDQEHCLELQGDQIRQHQHHPGQEHQTDLRVQPAAKIQLGVQEGYQEVLEGTGRVHEEEGEDRCQEEDDRG